MSKSRQRLYQSAGMTLVELMIAIAVTSLVMAFSIGIFTSQYTSFKDGKGVKAAQESNQGVITMLKRDIMEAGWSVKPEMALFLQDGGANASDTIFINETSLVALDNPALRAMMVQSDCAGCQRIMAQSSTTQVTIQDTDIDNDTSVDFYSALQQYVISDSATNKIGRITNITSASGGGSNLTFDRAISGNYIAPAVQYCVDAGAGTCAPAQATDDWALLRSGKSSGGALQAISENVVDLQVSYQDISNNWYGEPGCSGSGTGSNKCSMSPFDARRIRLIRLSVVTRGAEERAEGRKNDPRYCRPQLENRAAAAPGSNTECGYAYRTYTVDIQPRSTGPLYY